MVTVLRLCLVAFCVLLAPVAAPVWAQTEVAAEADSLAVDFAAWEEEATRAENLIEAGGASTSFFQNLRATLVDWRVELIAAQGLNADRIATLEAQIEALGPAPDDGTPEPDSIAERRQELTELLVRAQEPVRAATEAATRAEGLIREIDTLLRERQQSEFLELAPTPANPINWPTALTALGDVAVSLQSDLQTRLSNSAQREAAAENAPIILSLLILGLLAIFRGTVWTARFTRRLQRDAHLRGRAAVTFLVSLSQVAVPLAGVVAILAAVAASGMFGAQGQALLTSLGTLILAVFAARWLAWRIFPEGDGPLGALTFDEAQTASVKRVLVSIGLFFGLGTVVETVSAFNQVSPAARAVVTLPVLVLLALAYWRLSRLMTAGLGEPAAEDHSGFSRGFIALLARALSAVAIGGPVLAVVGYTNAAESIMLPTAQTLGIMGVLVALQPVIRDLYALAFRTTRSSASEALLPVVVNFLLVFAAVPLLALTWGVRPDQLADFYARFWQGVAVGEMRLTPGMILSVLAIFGIGLLATRLLQGALKSTVLPRTRLDTGARNALTSGVGYICIGLAAMVAITVGGIDLTALGFVLGALSVGIGFGLQNVVNNFVSGLILLIERPISEGDWIEVGGNMGIVKAISVRSTRIETFDRTDVIVPNADFISGTVTNWTRGNNIGRAVVTVGVAYGTDTRRVQDILTEIAKENPNVATFPEPGVDFVGFGADSLDFRVRAILRDVNQLVTVKTEIHHRIAERFAEEGIEIPFAQRDIWLRNPEALRAAPGDPNPSGDTATDNQEDTTP